MKRNIAIVAGGDTSEIVVSLRSAQGIYSFIDKEKYNLYIVEMEGRRWEVQLPDGNKVPVDRNDFSFTNGTEKVVFDFAYITIHGTPGEDGRLQGYFDMMRIPYSCCGVLAAAITYDKFTCNQYLKAFGVRIAESLLLRQGQSVSDEEVVEKIGLPCFIKPSLGGSSFGVTKVKTKEQIQPAIVKAFGEAEEEIVEAFMESVKNALIENKDKKGKDRGVFLRGFGSFIIKDRAPKVARNITEGTSIDIPAHCIPAFKPSKSFVAQIKNDTMKEQPKKKK